jgi:DNA polymerase III subunit epsilon
MNKEISLSELFVLVLDCQATGANPDKGHLLEIGWLPLERPDDSDKQGTPDVFLATLPEEVEIPRQISRITGIKNEDLDSALPPEDIWKKLDETVARVSLNNKNSHGVYLCPVIIHYKSFEERFLRHLYTRYSGSDSIPMEIICTHQLTRRLLPNLPRKGLRAISGYLGYSVPELRRSEHHVSATAFVWSRSVELLKEQGIHSLPQLKEWLSRPIARSKTLRRDFPMGQSLRKGLPDQPGVYRMFRSNGDLLYVGKATSLKKRVNSYFHKKKGSGQARQTLEMLTQAADLKVTVTGSALEAALLENDWIKKHSPPYNVALRHRDRDIVFFSADLLTWAAKSDNHHPVGPFPSQESLFPFAAVAALLQGKLNILLNILLKDLLVRGSIAKPNIPAIVLGSLPEYAPDAECFRDGLALFQERHGSFLSQLKRKSSDSFLRGLLQLGKEFRRKKLEELRLAALEKDNVSAPPVDTDTADESAESEPEEWAWTPEAVNRALEAIIRHGAHLIRRSRWYNLLSESVLIWNTGKTAGGKRRRMVLRSGTIIRQEDIEAESKPIFPPGFQRPNNVRRKNFDVPTYDRMRILTTELRRLVSEKNDRSVQLHLSPKVTLNASQLHRLLQWV